jgi:peptidoglycan/LPS O-acetylase OafA/YrhL
VASVFFYPNYTDGGISTGHFWSLSVEEQFYLLWPILLVVMRKSWRTPLTLIVLFIAPVSRVISLVFFDDLNESLLTQFEYCYDMLLAGCLLSLLRHDAHWKHRMRSGFLQSWKGLLIAFVLLGIGVGPIVPDHLGGIQQLAGSLGVALLINFVVEGHRTPLDTILNVSPMIWIGRLSYSLYLWQQLTCFVRPTGWWLNGFPQCVLFCVVAAMASYFLIEQPSLKLRDRLMRPKLKPALV